MPLLIYNYHAMGLGEPASRPRAAACLDPNNFASIFATALYLISFDSVFKGVGIQY